MSTIAWLVIGAVGASIFWLFAIAFLVDVVAAQRQALTQAQTSLRLYRTTRDESDRQVRQLLGQNERLAVQLLERASSTTVASIRVPGDFFQPGAES